MAPQISSPSAATASGPGASAEQEPIRYLLTKHTHALVTVEKTRGGQRLGKAVIDPGGFSPEQELREAVEGATVVLITHAHDDHVAPELLAELLADRPELPVMGPENVLKRLREAGVRQEQLHQARGVGHRQMGGFSVLEHGGQHALIHLLIPLEQNVGYLLDGAIYHPGDALTYPAAVRERRPKMLFVPTFTPWARLQEVMDFLVAVDAEAALPIHEGTLTEAGSRFATGIVDKVASHYRTDLGHWAPGQTRTFTL